MKNRLFSNTAGLLVLAMAFVTTDASASVAIEGSANSWLVQDYPAPQGVVLWYTGSSCVNGQLVFDVNEPQVRHNRLVAMILSAKATGARVHIDYNVNNGVCLISDFGVIGP